MEHEHGRIVVGVDGSSGSRVALEYTLRDAARRRSGVEVITAFAPPEYWGPLYGPPQITFDEVREGVRRDTENTVHDVIELLEGELAELPAVAVRAVSGHAAHALLQAARGADLLVVGSRGHGGFSSMLVGSVSLACMLHAACPVTIVRTTAEGRPEEPEESRAVPTTT
jgi:nucleotide-binding universal stress UspA family protein